MAIQLAGAKAPLCLQARMAAVMLLFSLAELAHRCDAQVSAVDVGQNRWGQRRGDWSPGEWAGATLLFMTILAGLSLVVGLCYYVSKRTSRTRLRYAQPAQPALVMRI